MKINNWVSEKPQQPPKRQDKGVFWSGSPNEKINKIC